MLKVERNKINKVLEKLAEVEGISEVYSVAGKYDLIVIIRVQDNKKLADLVTGSMLKVEGILDSETMVAFKVNSKHALENMFSVGFEK